jgi:DNA segregation ATPase FtsK/SpoIIIE-like protein
MEKAETKDVLDTLRVLVINRVTDVSISLIQRKMRIGFNKSASILEQLVESKIVRRIEKPSGQVVKYKMTTSFVHADL